MRPVSIELPNEGATIDLAARIARLARPGDVIALIGALGSGKTVFARAFISASGGGSDVPSPTFTLVQTYEGHDLRLYHFDFFRLEHAEEAYELDIEDAFSSGVSLIEWPDRAAPLLPNDRLDLRLKTGPSPGVRRATLSPGATWHGRIKRLQKELKSACWL